MKAIGLLAVASISLAVGYAQESKPDKNWAKLASLSAVRSPITNVAVFSGAELEVEGVRCRLFGIKLLGTPSSQAEAKRFLKLYLKDYGGYFSIYNDNSPINDKDGTPLIWLKGHGNGGWAQEVLVQAGLVQRHDGFTDYKFKTPTKAGWDYFDWKTCLSDAEKSFKRRGRVNINFSWPEPSTNKPANSP